MTHPFLSRREAMDAPLPAGPLRAADPHETALEAANVPEPDVQVPWPWDALQRTAGPLLPGSLTIVSARTGSGKTTFIRNWLHWLGTVSGDYGPSVGYFPTETPVADVLRDMTCADLGIHPTLIAHGDFSSLEGGRLAFFEHAKRVSRALLHKRSDLTGAPLMLFDHPRPSVPLISETLREAVRLGCTVAIIDHLLRLDLGDGTKPFAEVTAGVRALKMLAQKLRIAIVVASQQNRAAFAGDRLAAFQPPDLSALKGAGTIEEEADLVIFLHRVLRDDLTDGQLTDVRRGRLPLQDAVARNIMGVAIGKHRLDGSKVAQQERLWVENGVLRDLPTVKRMQWEALRRSIQPNRGA